MKAVEPTSCPSVPPWAEAFPRLFEIYTASNQAAPGNWFQEPNVWRGLLDNSTSLRPIEEDLQVLDAASRAVFQVKAGRLVHLMDEWGYSRALFDCFNEIKGYRYLVREGYQEVRFVPEQQDTQTPDLRARSGTSVVVMEVKTVNESTRQNDVRVHSAIHTMRAARSCLSPCRRSRITSTPAMLANARSKRV